MASATPDLRWTSPPFHQYQIIGLPLGHRGRCVWAACAGLYSTVQWMRLEPATSRSRVRRSPTRLSSELQQKDTKRSFPPWRCRTTISSRRSFPVLRPGAVVLFTYNSSSTLALSSAQFHTNDTVPTYEHPKKTQHGTITIILLMPALTDWLEFHGTFSTIRLCRVFTSYSLVYVFGLWKHPESLVHLLFGSGW